MDVLWITCGRKPTPATSILGSFAKRLLRPLLVLTGHIDQDVMLPLMIGVRLDVSSLKFDAHGRLVKAAGSFEAAYSPARLEGVDWDRMVGNEAVLKGIEGHLAELGYAGGFWWKKPGLLQA